MKRFSFIRLPKRAGQRVAVRDWRRPRFSTMRLADGGRAWSCRLPWGATALVTRRVYRRMVERRPGWRQPVHSVTWSVVMAGPRAAMRRAR